MSQGTHHVRRAAAVVVMASVLGTAATVGTAQPVLAAAVLVVDTLSDLDADDGSCSLREAIIAADTDTDGNGQPGECSGGSGTDTISFSASGTISLTADLPSISSGVSIDGGTDIVVDGADSYRPFTVASGDVLLEGLTITHGLASGDPPYEGGGIHNAGSLSLVDVVVTGNNADIGGGIFNDGTLSIESSEITDNEGGGPVGGGYGGGMYGGTITVTSSMISGNYAGASGGVGGNKVTITDSTVRDNGGDFGGGVMGTSVTIIRTTIASNGAYARGGGISAGTVLLINSTVADNGAGDAGGGINAEGTVTAINSTIARNHVSLAEFAAGGGGIAATSVILKNTIVAGNTSPKAPNIAGTIVSRVRSIVGVPAGLTLADILDPDGLQDHGGSTETIALAETIRNAAREAADPAICAEPPVGGFDQRREPRPSGACDIGAFELPTPVERSPFTDTAESGFRWDIEWLWATGITGGCTVDRYCPNDNVTRAQMASFLDRALDLPSTTTDYFSDDNGRTGEASINRLAASGITGGCAAGRFCPTAPVTRGQMAAFLARAFSLPTTTTDYFTDDETSTFESSINRVAAADITGGCGGGKYCPLANVTRGQMAAFLHRALD